MINFITFEKNGINILSTSILIFFPNHSIQREVELAKFESPHAISTMIKERKVDKIISFECKLNGK